MKVSDVISQLDDNNDLEEVTGWLLYLDMIIFNNIVVPYTLEETMPKPIAYTSDSELMVREPYSAMYTYYVKGMINLKYGEMERYINNMNMYNSIYQSLTDWISRNNSATRHYVRI